MIGNRVRVILADAAGQCYGEVTGILHELAAGKGATIWREHSLPEGQGIVFIPMHRIYEIVDLGRPL